MSALGSLVVKLALEYAEYTQGLDRSDQAALAFAQRAQKHFDTASQAGKDFMGGMVTSAVGAVTAIVSIGAALDVMNRSIDDLAALDDLAQKTGAPIENLSRLQQVARTFGQDFGSVDAALVKLSKGMASADEDSSKVQKALKALGVSAKDATGKLRDPAEVFIESAKALQGYEDGAGKVALMNDLLGKSGADLMPFMNDTAESIDKFTGRSAEATAQAARFQDQLGFMKNRLGEVAIDITSGVLPAVNDLLEAFVDTSRAGDELADNEVLSWIDDAAVGLARVIDVARLLPRILSAVGGSFQAVGADIKVMGAVVESANPLARLKAQANGTSLTDELRKAVAERNKVVADANQQLADLWNKPVDEMEQAMLKRLAARGVASTAAPAATDEQKKSLGYESGTVPAAKAEKDDYDALIKAVRERLALAQDEAVAGRKLSDAEKEIVKVRRGYADGTLNLTSAQAALIVATLEQTDTIQKSNDAARQVEQLYKSIDEAARKKLQTAQEEADANELLAATFGKSKAEIEALELARLEEQLAQRASTGMTMDEIAELEKLIAAKKRNAAALANVEGLEGAKKGLDELDAFLDPAKAQSFGESLKEAFGTAGDAISKVTAVLDGYGQRQAEIAKQRAKADEARQAGLLSEADYQKRLGQLNDKETKNRLAGYGDMAGAAAGFFDEQSRGYQAMMAVSKVFHAAELAMTLAELVPKGISAVLSQGQGDPYSAFARMAAMAAVVTALGVAIGGGFGGGGQSAEEMQRTQGTGSVLGDSEAQSESITNSLELLEENSDRLIPINREMLTALQSIDAAIGGLTNLVVRVPGLVEGGNLGITTGTTAASGSLGDRAIGSTVGSIVGLAFGPLGAIVGGVLGDVAARLWGKTKKEIVDSGLQFGGNVRDLEKGIGYSQYASVDTTKSSWFGLSKKTSNSVETAALSPELAAQFGLVFSGVEAALEAAAVSMGVGANHVTGVLDNLSLDLTKVSLKGLKGDELTAALNAVLSKAMDDMSAAVFPALDRFRQIGEGYTETVVRLASDYARLDAALASNSMTFGAVGLASLDARERLITLTGGIDALEEHASSFAENYLTEAERLAPVQKYVTEQLGAMGLASIATRDQFKAVVLAQDLTTEAGAKQYAALMSLEAAFTAVTPAMNEVASAADILADRHKLEGQIYDMTHTAAEALARQRAEELAAIDAALRPLQERIYALQDEEAAADSAKQAVASLADAGNAAFSVLQTVLARNKDALAKAHEAEGALLQKRIESQTAAVTKLRSLSQSLQATVDQLKIPEQAQASRLDAQAQIKAALAIARAGGPLPDADRLQGALSAITSDTSAQFATYADYLRDFYATSNDVAELSKLTDGKLSIEERTLDALNDQKEAADEAYRQQIERLDTIAQTAQQQLAVLTGTDTSLLTIADALAGLESVLQSSKASSAISAAYQTELGRAPDAAGFAYWQQQAAAGTSTGEIVDSIKNSAEAQIRKLYASVLGRMADRAGLEYWVDQVNAGTSINDVRAAFESSPEYLASHKVPAFATGGDHAGGLRLVGERGPELEVTGPSRIYNTNQTARILGGNAEVQARDNEALRREIAALRKMMEEHLYAIAKNTMTSADIQQAWDMAGQPQVRPA